MEIKLDSKAILEKEFKTGLRGYNQEEVDLFLDDIIQDYEAYKKMVADLRSENARLNEELEACQKRLTTTTNTGSTNFDLLKRISNLEKHVFGSKLYDHQN